MSLITPHTTNAVKIIVRIPIASSDTPASAKNHVSASVIIIIHPSALEDLGLLDGLADGLVLGDALGDDDGEDDGEEPPFVMYIC